MANAFGLTDAQIHRQLDKIMEVLFDDVKDLNEDEYGASVKPEIIDIFLKQFPKDSQDGMTPEDFEKRLGQVGMELIKYINEAKTGINDKLLLYFLSDFISQVMSNIFTVREEDQPDSADFMYG
jgi:hypothetical protein